jgi:hypothetical protein
MSAASSKGELSETSFDIRPRTKRLRSILIFPLLLFLLIPISAKTQQAETEDSTTLAPAEQQTNSKSAIQKIGGGLEAYLNMASSQTAKQFKPLTQKQRTDLYLRTFINPWGYAKTAFSAGLDQWHDKPFEWGQDFQGYGERFGNIQGQYITQRTVTYLLSSGLHEDNRYFGSGKHGVWPRTEYAVAHCILARHDDGSLHVSVSQLTGVAAGAFVARLWLPPSQSSPGDAAVSFGLTMASNVGITILKEFLPDVLRAIDRKPRPSPAASFQ